MTRRFVAGAVGLACAALVTVAAQGPPPEMRARVDAFFAALASGDAARYEAMARENFTAEHLNRRTPDERRQFVDRLRSECGTLTLKSAAMREEGVAVLTMAGSTGLSGTIEVTLDRSAPFKIAGIQVKLGGPGPGAGPDALPPPPVNAAMTRDDLARALDAYLAPLAASDAFAGVVLVAKDGVPVFERAYGPADREKKLPAAPGTRFCLGSIGKAFTKTAIGQLIAQGKLSPADTIGRLLPDYPNPAARAATVEQLLTHRAGIADFFGPAFAAAPKTNFRSNADYYRFVAPQPLLFEPGSRTQYCNGCYVVLGAIVERVSGVRYEDYIAEHVFKPAGMTGAGFFQMDRLPDRVAVGYTRRSPDSGGALKTNVQMHGAAGSAAGGSYATAADLLAFDNALREGRLLDPKMTAWYLGVARVGPGRATGDVGIAGGAPGMNASLESNGAWTVAVVSNLDPPAAEQLGVAIGRQLTK
jgi:D-alanyl-D-alanine carboxypeptidase